MIGLEAVQKLNLLSIYNFNRSSSLDYNWLVLMTGGPDAGGSPVAMLVWIGLLFALMYLMLIRPQRKKQKEHDKLLTELQVLR